VSDPDSARYGQYLTSEEFESKYSPTAEDFALVRSYLESEGFTVTYVPRGRQFISARAAASDVERVFATRLGDYEVEGELRHAPMEVARIPAAIGSRVSTVLGLAASRFKPGLVKGRVGPASSNAAAPDCAGYYGQYVDTTDPPYGGGYPNPTLVHPCGLTPPRMRRAYGLSDAVEDGNDGRGVTVAIVDAGRWPTLVSDAQAFAAQFDSKHPLLASQIRLIDAPSGGDPPMPVDPSWIYEQVFDVEWVHALAPGAHILYVGSATGGSQDVIAALNLIVQNRLANVVSNSYALDFDDPGPADADIEALDPILLRAAIEGIGMYFCSWDFGDNQVLGAGPGGAPAVVYPASNPYVTAVGGTSMYLGADGLPVYETGWESGDSTLAGSGTSLTWAPRPPGLFYFGSGGGPSHRYIQPRYQGGVVPLALAGTPPMRVLPDVAMLGDEDSGGIEALTDPITGVYTLYPNSGGTSLATPMFAGTMALAEQRAGHRLGFANPRLYKVGTSAFHDIVPTPTPQDITHPAVWLDTEDPPGLMVQRPDGSIHPHTLHSAPGFDNVTGLGVPAGEAFLAAVAGDN
jgi:subtilase family serine protease